MSRVLGIVRYGPPPAEMRALAQRRAGALVVSDDPLLIGYSQQIVALAARHAVPTIYFFRSDTVNGGLMSYGTR